jgi:hypothetical protein
MGPLSDKKSRLGMKKIIARWETILKHRAKFHTIGAEGKEKRSRLKCCYFFWPDAQALPQIWWSIPTPSGEIEE